MSDPLAFGVASRLSRYLQVATQARRMGKTRLSSPRDPRPRRPAQDRARRQRRARRDARQLDPPSRPRLQDRGRLRAQQRPSRAAPRHHRRERLRGDEEGRPRAGDHRAAVLTLPAEAAQRATDDLAAAGVQVIVQMLFLAVSLTGVIAAIAILVKSIRKSPIAPNHLSAAVGQNAGGFRSTEPPSG